MMNTGSTTLQSPNQRAINKRSYFYVATAITALLVVVFGFFPTYITPMMKSNFSFRPLVHLHGAVYMSWILLFILQPWLARQGNIKTHRKIGVAGFILAASMVILGIAVAITGAKLGSATMSAGGLPPEAFLLIPLTDMLLFSLFIGLSLANLKKPEVHKRLMLLATVAILPAAFGRIFGHLNITSIPVSLLFLESLLIIAVIYDWINKRKVHPVYIWGGLFMMVVHFLRFPIAASAWWLSVGERLTQ